MTDRVDKATRSRIMRANKSKDTKPEVAVRRALHEIGVRCHRGDHLPGKPDIVLRRDRLAVFVHGCFWHQCPVHGKLPKDEGWVKKFDANRRRDERVRRQLRRLGWATAVVWEHEDPMSAAARISRRMWRIRRA
jgi:DNA mismatch endonuclease, patch repair protein